MGEKLELFGLPVIVPDEMPADVGAMIELGDFSFYGVTRPSRVVIFDNEGVLARGTIEWDDEGSKGHIRWEHEV